MAMNSFRIVESFQIFENQTVCLLVIANFKAVEPFTFDVSDIRTPDGVRAVRIKLLIKDIL